MRINRQINASIIELALLPDVDEQRVERVAQDLERYTYEPIFLFPIPGFIRFVKTDVIAYMESLVHMSEDDIRGFGVQSGGSPEDILTKQVKMVLRNYRLLTRLRADEPEAWDEIHELYEDD